MKLSIHSFRLPLSRPLTMLGHRYSSRSGILLGIEDDDGRVGWGEISPMPGLHRETLDDVRAVLKKQFRNIQALLSQPLSLSEYLNSLSPSLTVHKSIAYGLEMAFLNLFSQKTNQPIANLLSEDVLETVSINGLISIDQTNIDRSLEAVLQKPVRSLKLKVGQHAVEQDVERVRLVRSKLPAHISLRLDANCAWEYDEAMRFASGIEPDSIEYIEEPLRDNRQLARFFQDSGLPIALDESLLDQTPQNAELSDGIAAVILKPGYLGGFTECQAWGRLAKAAGAKCVVSCALQSGLGLHAAANLAAVLNDIDVPCGLGTFAWLAEDLIEPAFASIAGQMQVKISDTVHWQLRKDMISSGEGSHG